MLKKILLASFCSAALVFTACNDEVEENKCEALPSGQIFKLTYPKGGETFKVGAKITLSWTVDNKQVTQVIPKISVDNGISFQNIPQGTGIAVPSGDQFQCMEYSWTIGQEGETVDYQATNTAIIQLQSYTEPTVYKVFDQQTITINQ